jgi:hypothetical protein
MDSAIRVINLIIDPLWCSELGLRLGGEERRMVWLALSRTSALSYQTRVRDLSRHRQASFAALIFLRLLFCSRVRVYAVDRFC